MSVATMVKMPSQVPISLKTKQRKVTIEEFYKKYAERKDGFKYEYQFGEIIKTPSVMNPDILYLMRKLNLVFYKTQAFKQGCVFEAEVNFKTSDEQTRRPDKAMFTDEQIHLARSGKKNVVPAFVVECISTHDSVVTVTDKIIEYFNVGVQVYWQIQRQLVYVYTSPTQIMVCKGDSICSAAPVLPDFQISAKDLFE